MPVITSDFSFRVDTFKQFRGWLVIRVLWHKFTVNGEVEDFAFGLLDDCLQVRFVLFYLVY